MIALFTDFGLHGPYTGQMKAVLHQMAQGIPIVDLFADAPVGNPKSLSGKIMLDCIAFSA
jgi:S-adenosylmethionine hydrolase